MDLLKSSKRRSFLSELVYIVLNVGLAVAILAVVLAIESPLPAFALVLLSKWRVLAVRPRYWMAHIKANLVDIIVSLSYVVLLYAAGGAFFLQVGLSALFVVWLLFIKPRSKRTFIAIQAGTALFFGVTALMTVSYDWSSLPVVLGMWVIGYATGRHVLTSYEDPHSSFYSLVWGLVVAELGWLTYHWTFAYSIPGFGGVKLAQAALIVLAIGFVVERAYGSYHQHGTIKSSDLTLPVLLSVSVILILVFFFNTLGTGGI